MVQLPHIKRENEMVEGIILSICMNFTCQVTELDGQPGYLVRTDNPAGVFKMIEVSDHGKDVLIAVRSLEY